MAKFIPLRSKISSLSLGIKLLLPGLVALAVFVAAITVFWNGRLERALESGKNDRISGAISFLSTPLADALWNFDDRLAETALIPFTDLTGAVFARVVSNGDVFAEARVQDYRSEEWEQIITALLADNESNSLTLNSVTYVHAPLSVNEERVGDLVLAFEGRAMDATLAEGQRLAGIIGLITFASFAVVLFLNTFQVTRPLKRLLHHLSSLHEGNYDIDIEQARRGDEIGKLGAALEVLRDVEVERQRMAEQERFAHASQQNVVTVLGGALSSLADGKLTIVINDTFPETYRGLQVNFNRTTEALRKAIVDIFDAGEEIARDAREVFSASQGLARRAEQQAANSTAAATALNQITDAMQSVSAICEDAKGEASASQSDVRAAGVVVEDAVRAMGDIDTATQQIHQIASEIDEIAFQTNILSLNAGVEAARAGEAGRGFAIVATEVRNLAGRASEMASEISSLLSKSREAVDQGTRLVKKAGVSMNGVGDRVFTMSGFIDNISSSIKDQNSALGEVKGVIANVDSMAQNNESMAEETLAASQSIETVGQGLLATIAQFDVGRDAQPMMPLAKTG